MGDQHLGVVTVDKLELIGQIPNNPVIFVKGEDGFLYGVHIVEFPVKNLNAPF